MLWGSVPANTIGHIRWHAFEIHSSGACELFLPSSSIASKILLSFSLFSLCGVLLLLFAQDAEL